MVAEYPLFMEMVNDSLVEHLVTDLCAAPKPEPTENPSLSEDERIIIRYACRYYVGIKLHDKFEKRSGEKAASFVRCIKKMQASGQLSSFFWNIATREWTHRVNRGGLFVVSDERYYLFLSIELAMHGRLSLHLESPHSGGKDEIIQYVCEDTDVQFHWCMILVDIDSEKDCYELLKHIVTLWLTIRGHSVAKMWMEQYKCAACETTRKKKALRNKI